MPLKTVDELLVSWMGPNWKTTANGYLAAVMWICSVLLPVLTPFMTRTDVWAKVAAGFVTAIGIISTICRIVVGNLQVDSKPHQ